MGHLDGKTALIFGVANKHSIAWGIAQAFKREGAQVGLSYAMDRLERRVRPLGECIGSRLIEPCDVTDDAALDRVFETVRQTYGSIDIVVHSIAFAGREELSGRFVHASRSGFTTALEISAYSLVALAQRAEPLMPRGGAIVTMTALGGVKVLPSYNVMGVAKAALEACVRYLAYDLGPRGLRVNAISAGPIKTLAASGVAGFKASYRYHETASPLRRLVTQADVGQAAVYLCSDMGQSVTGEILYVDSGWSILGMTAPLEDEPESVSQNDSH
jgi:enoyl-[acyl-carrier protein] reductase I